MKRSCDVVTGAFGFIGSFLASKLSESKPILLTTKVRENESGLPYNMAEGLDSLNNLDVHVNNIFHLAHDFTNKTINGENINIKAIKDLIVFCKKNDSKLIYISSFMAIPATSDYGRIKLDCEELVKSYNKSIIIRPPVVIDSAGGIFFKLNNIFKYLPFFLIPGNGNYTMYYVEVENLVDFIVKCREIDSNEILYCYDKGPIVFKDLLKINKKLVIKVPIVLLRIILFLPRLIGLKIKNLNNEGLTTLLTMPRINFKHKNYKEYKF